MPLGSGAQSGSLGYCERLSYREDLGGTLGDPELDEPELNVAAKACALAEAIDIAEHLVAFTGAGISTSAGIPDFRGPNGLWTKQRRGEALPKASMPFEQACPSLTHQSLLALLHAGRLKYLVSQNVDSLHLRSGFPRAVIAELHGNCFAERCASCAAEYVRDFEVGSVGFQPTGRTCSACLGPLIDHCLDWDNALPEDELDLAEKHAGRADLALCLGTSLIVTPARDIPTRAIRKRKHKPEGGRLAIVNLQATPLDKRAALVLHASVDQVMLRVMSHLRLPIPAFCRHDTVIVLHDAPLARPLHPSTHQDSRHSAQLRLQSAHGVGCPLPWLRAVEVRLVRSATERRRQRPLAPHEHSPQLLPPKVGTMRAPDWFVEVPIEVTPAVVDVGYITARLTFFLAAATNAPSTSIVYSIPLDRDGKRRYDIITARVQYGEAWAAEELHCRTPAGREQLMA